MNYQTFETTMRNLFSDVMGWFADDPIHRGMYVVIGIAVVGAINGVRLSLNRCKGRYNGRIL